MTTSLARRAALGAVLVLSAAGLIWWQRADEPAEAPSFAPLRENAERSEADSPLRSQGGSEPSRTVPITAVAPRTEPEAAPTRSDATSSEASSALVFVYGRIEVTPTGLAAPPEILSVRFVDATSAKRDVRLHEAGRYTCSDVAPGRCIAEVYLSSRVNVEIACEVPAQVHEHRLDLRVSAPYHVSIPVLVMGSGNRRLAEDLGGTKLAWNPITGLAPLGIWVVASETEPPPELRIANETLRSTWGIGRWYAHEHLMAPKDHDGTLELLRWAPTTYVALYWRDRRIELQHFQQPPEKLVFRVDPTPIRDTAPAAVEVRCLNASDGLPLQLIQFAESGSRGLRFLPLTDGRARVEGLIPGPRILELRPLGLAARRIELDLASGETRDLGDLFFDRGRSLRVRALDAAGKPFAGSIRVAAFDAEPASSVTTFRLDAEGRGELSGLAPAEHVVILESDQASPEKARFVFDLRAGDVLDAEVRWPTEQFALDLRVQLEPCDEAWCEVRDGEGRLLLRWLATGAFHRELPLVRGSYRLMLMAPDGTLLDEASIELPLANPEIRLAKRAR